MNFELESLEYQQRAIAAVVATFEGTERNTFDNATREGLRANLLTLTDNELEANIGRIMTANGIDTGAGKPSPERELTIEMETGTGKTLVYLKTIYELHKHYGFTKFIILVPSVAIRQGVITTINSFSKQLEAIYGFTPKSFEYDSKKLNRVASFIEEQHPQIMVMTLASFNSEDKILNQAQREDLFANLPYIKAIAHCSPIVLMDEPQVGMDTENSVKQIARLNPLFKIRYSATHATFKNLIYRLTPYDSYRQRLVKKIEVLTVTEKNDEAAIKLEFSEVHNSTGDPKAKIKAWHCKADGKVEFKETAWLKKDENLGEKTKNPSYNNYTIRRINKSLKSGQWQLEFTNDVTLQLKAAAGNLHAIWALQVEWLLYRHFAKAARLREQGIKCLSLIFIDRVANFMGDDPVIKRIFQDKYRAVYPEFHGGTVPTEAQMEAVLGYYFASNAKGEFHDNEGGLDAQKKIYKLILEGKEELLRLDNPVQFIFSHSALGVGWDNPNIFNIATLNQTFSEIKKRQEIGRGLRIAVNQDGKRVYDKATAPDSERINQLTVIPNETYETFVTQYQQEIKELYGDADKGAGFIHTHKGDPKNHVSFKLNRSETLQAAFRRFWQQIARKTDYTIVFDEDELVRQATEALNSIRIEGYTIEVASNRITEIDIDGVTVAHEGAETYRARIQYAPIDLVEELSENTGLSYTTVLKIMRGLTNFAELIKSPLKYMQQAIVKIKHVEENVMLRGLTYQLTGESYPFDFADYVANLNADRYVDTPKRGVLDKMLYDSDVERQFALGADSDHEVVCFLKLPDWYKIPLPGGLTYEPDFGVVFKRKSLKTGNESEFYFVIETKGTNNLDDTKALTESERYKIKCAIKHFEALGIEVEHRVHYEAPVKDYATFKSRATAETQVAIA